jgi:hypothetical protein
MDEEFIPHEVFPPMQPRQRCDQSRPKRKVPVKSDSEDAISLWNSPQKCKAPMIAMSLAMEPGPP